MLPVSRKLLLLLNDRLRFINNRLFSTYRFEYDRSLNDRDSFWKEQAQHIHWDKLFTKVLDDKEAPFYKWFPGGLMNTCFNCLDKHILLGNGNRNAIIYDSPVSNTSRVLTYNDLHKNVVKISYLLRREGVVKGDSVIIFMPNLPEAITAMLACARIGAIHSVVFGGFAPEELSIRINNVKPKVIITASCGIEKSRSIPYMPIVNAALELSKPTHNVHRCIIYQRMEFYEQSLQRPRDIDWNVTDSMDTEAASECTPVESSDPLYVLYTSGTTGNPKGIQRDNGGHAVALSYAMRSIYDAKPGDVFWAASDIGWVVGHSFIVYGPLLAGCTTVLYEGKPVGTPDADAFWRIIERYKVNFLSTAPTALRAIKRVDSHGVLPAKYNLSSLRGVFLAGERADHDSLLWAEKALGVPIRDHWWQTETGWPICSNLVGLEGFLPVRYGSTYHPCPGFDVRVVTPSNTSTEQGGFQLAPRKQLGSIVIRLPLPPGAMTTLWGNDRRYIDAYLTEFPGYYSSGDEGIIDDDGYVHVMSRSDDVINVAGHRLSSGRIEEVIADHPDVAEVAVVALPDSLRGQEPVALVVLNSDCERDHAEVLSEVVQLVRSKIGSIAALRRAVCVARLPKTRTGKVFRNVLRKIANKEAYKVPPTIEDASVLQDIEALFKNL